MLFSESSLDFAHHKRLKLSDAVLGIEPLLAEVMTSIAAKVGCTTQTVSDRDRLKLLERELKELRRANEILRKASAYFAQAELDRHGKWRRGSSTLTGKSWVSSRSAANWRSLRRPTTSMLPGLPIPAGVRHLLTSVDCQSTLDSQTRNLTHSLHGRAVNAEARSSLSIECFLGRRQLSTTQHYKQFDGGIADDAAQDGDDRRRARQFRWPGAPHCR
jgi:transposase